MKQQRREGVLKRLKKQLVGGVKVVKDVEIPLEPRDKERIKKEISILNDRLAGKKKGVKELPKGAAPEAPKQKWFIDIYQIHLGYVKNSERRKNKGKSRKKMRKTRNVTFVKSVIMQEGMMQAYREGRMGISPKNHSFRARREEPTFIN